MEITRTSKNILIQGKAYGGCKEKSERMRVTNETSTGEEPAREVKRRSESDKVAGGERSTGRSKQREEEENGGHQSAPVR